MSFGDPTQFGYQFPSAKYNRYISDDGTIFWTPEQRSWSRDISGKDKKTSDDRLMSFLAFHYNHNKSEYKQPRDRMFKLAKEEVFKHFQENQVYHRSSSYLGYRLAYILEREYPVAREYCNGETDAVRKEVGDVKFTGKI